MIVRVTLRVMLATGILLGFVRNARAAGPPFELTVKKDHFFGSSKGTLVFDVEGVEYRTSDKDDARKWTYPDVKQVQILAPTRIAVLTYEDQGRLRLGADRTFAFEVTQGAVSSDLVAFLLDRIERPIVTALMPPGAGRAPLFHVPVKHQRGGRRSEGTLELYDDRLVYLTESEAQARYWRIGDIFAVLQLDRYRLQILAYEGGGGQIRTFTFELKADLAEGFFAALWAMVNPPRPWGVTTEP